MPESERSKPSFSVGRRWLIWLNTFLAVAAVLAMVVMINYLASGYFKRIQMARDSTYTLSSQTLHILQDLTNDVKVTLFFQPNGDNQEIYVLASSLLEEYQQANPRHLHVSTLDYTRDVGAAKDLLSKHNLSALSQKDFVMIESGPQSKVIYAKDLADYDFSDLLAGRSKYVRRSSFRGEMFFTADIYAVSNPQSLKAYFLYGNGENDPDDNKPGHNGYSKFAAVLTNEINCDWEKLSLQGTNEIPADCQLLIVAAGAHEDMMTAAEVGKIAAYLKQGGRLMALLTVNSGLETVLQNWGVMVSKSRVVEDKQFSLSDLTFLTATEFPHPIMDSLISERMPLEMVYPRAVGKLPNQPKIPGGPEVTVLAATSPSGMDDAKQVGSFPLLVAVEQGVIQGVNTSHGGGTRIVVAGDSDFLDDQVIDSVGNHYFAGNALNWLLERPTFMLSGLGPRPIKEYKLYMTPRQAQAVQILFLAVMPGAVLLLGALVWLRRRS
jgi:ABC-2 type transport system permease protein